MKSLIKTTFIFSFLIAPFYSMGQNTFPFPANDSVGIGTTTPSTELEVVGTVKSNKAIFHNSGGFGFPLMIGEEWSAGRRNIEFTVTPTWLQNLWYDNGGNLRYLFRAQTMGTSLTMNDENGSEIFKIDEGGLANNKVFFHLPKADSRIVIGEWGTYKPDHKLVIKDGSALVEGNLYSDGSVAIGNSSLIDGLDTFRLSVSGKVRAHEVQVYTTWADYVFKDDYELLPLNEVASFIEDNGHLPNVPSEKEVQENGIDLGQMNAKLLEKIEELTLYLLQQQKDIDKLKNDLSTLKTH